MPNRDRKAPLVCYTVGHSTRRAEAFIHLLQIEGIECIMDIRTIARSRHNPQFNKDILPESLAAAGISYTHAPGLGGLRRPQAGSPNTGWRNASFQGFADYMQTEKFAIQVAQLIELLPKARLALMCAEAVPWRCHRSLVADALVIRGIQVEHIISPAHRLSHAVTSWARVVGTTITYPPQLS